MDRSQLARLISSHIAVQLYDESRVTAQGTAIYYLSDPREIRAVCYVGQTKNPKQRFAQHLNTARLWLTDERPWWVKSPRLRPLSDWIRQLYRDNYRLPTMIVTQWVDNSVQARLAERARICDCIQNQHRLLNFETEIMGQQYLLL